MEHDDEQGVESHQNQAQQNMDVLVTMSVGSVDSNNAADSGEKVYEKHSLHKMGYTFNGKGKLCELTSGNEVFFDDSSFGLEEQSHFDLLLGAAKDEIEKMLVDKLSLVKICGNTGNISQSSQEEESKDGRYFFTSWNMNKDATGLVVLIEGFGTAGQWDPRLVLSDGIETGSQLPFISKCHDNGWAVVVLDASCKCEPEKKNDEETEEEWKDDIGDGDEIDTEFEFIEKNYCDCEQRCIRDCANCLEELLNIWMNNVISSSFSKIAVVAHHCGASLAENILRQKPGQSRLKAVCLSDWTLLYAPNEDWWRQAVRLTRHWVPSGRPCGAAEKIRYGVRCFSAGTRDPRKIPTSACEDMIRFITEQFGCGPYAGK